jgi:hypothetical protein
MKRIAVILAITGILAGSLASVAQARSSWGKADSNQVVALRSSWG